MAVILPRLDKRLNRKQEQFLLIILKYTNDRGINNFYSYIVDDYIMNTAKKIFNSIHNIFLLEDVENLINEFLNLGILSEIDDCNSFILNDDFVNGMAFRYSNTNFDKITYR